jgi:pimeloyl-ACP methyl ester carboxylesterase
MSTLTTRTGGFLAALATGIGLLVLWTRTAIATKPQPRELESVQKAVLWSGSVARTDAPAANESNNCGSVYVRLSNIASSPTAELLGPGPRCKRPGGPHDRVRSHPTTRERTMTITTAIPGTVKANGLDIYVEQVGQGPDVLLIGGLGDTVESWQFQLDGLAGRYRLTAFDNRGAGRTPMPDGPLTVEAMADDAAGVLRALDIASAHVAGFSGGSIIAQELALRHPDLVRSLVLQSTWPAPDRYLRAWGGFVRWLVEAAPSERAFLEGFFLDIYTPRAHNDGTVDQIIEAALAFPHKQAPGDVQRFLDAFLHHDTSGRLPQIAAPTLVLAGGLDTTSRPELCRAVAELIPDARFEVMEEESHQPFQEVPGDWNARVDAFWREVAS